MSDTPRTDSMQPYLPPYNEHPLVHVPKTFARQLERELNAANQTIKNCHDFLLKLRVDEWFVYEGDQDASGSFPADLINEAKTLIKQTCPPTT